MKKKTAFRERKINTPEAPWTKSVSRDEKINLQASRRENSTNNRIHEQESARNKFQEPKQQATGSMNKINFTRRKIHVRVSQSEISRCQKFHEQKLASNKFHEQNMFQVKKNQCISFTMRKNQHGRGFTKKQISKPEVPGTKDQQTRSSMNKISFTRRKINV